MFPPRSRTASLAALLVVGALIASACGQSDAPEVVDLTEAEPAEAASTPAPLLPPQTTEAASDTAQPAASDAEQDGEPAQDLDAVEAADEGSATNLQDEESATEEADAPPPVRDENQHPMIATVVDESELQSFFDQAFYSSNLGITQPEARSGPPSCQQPDGAPMHGVNAEFETVDGTGFLGIIMMKGDDVASWHEAFRVVPTCPGFNMVLTDLTVDGATESVVLANGGESPQGFMAAATASNDDVIAVAIAIAPWPDSPLADHELLAQVVASGLDRAVQAVGGVPNDELFAAG